MSKDNVGLIVCMLEEHAVEFGLTPMPGSVVMPCEVCSRAVLVAPSSQSLHNESKALGLNVLVVCSDDLPKPDGDGEPVRFFDKPKDLMEVMTLEEAFSKPAAAKEDQP